jgi:hypothetical protein
VLLPRKLNWEAHGKQRRGFFGAAVEARLLTVPACLIGVTDRRRLVSVTGPATGLRYRLFDLGQCGLRRVSAQPRRGSSRRGGDRKAASCASRHGLPFGPRVRANDPNAILFQTYSRATGQLTGNRLPQANAYEMIQRRAKSAGIVMRAATR